MCTKRQLVVIGTSYDRDGQARHQITEGVSPTEDLGDVLERVYCMVDAAYATRIRLELVL